MSMSIASRGKLSLSLALAFASAVTLGCGAGLPPSAPQAGYSRPITSTSAEHGWLEINKGAFERNARALQSFVGPKVKICAILKADAYGHGLALLMPSILALGLPCIGIGANREAEIARAAGFTGRILRVRTATAGEVEDGLKEDIEEMVGNPDLAREISAIARKRGRVVRYHLALNAGGMSRNGLDLELPANRTAALEMLRLPGLQIVGIMTHFPVEDAADVRKVLATFNEQASWVIREGGLHRDQLTLHAAASFAILEVPESHLDMVRPGASLYGETVGSHAEYEPIITFKSRVASVNLYAAGNTVTYDRTFVLRRDSRLANIPVGYSDGVRRVFSNRGHVLIRGHRLPIVGRVTMNTVMVDATDHPDIRGGDEVVLFGRQGSDAITQAEVEQQADTIIGDLRTMWGNSNPRVLIDR
jgi:alanine racemase